MKKVIIALFAMAIIAVPFAALAGAEDKDISEELNLSTRQIEQIRQQDREQTRIEERLQSQIRLKEEALKKELAKEEEPNKEKVRAMVREVNRLRSQLFEERIQGIMDTRKVLSREQVRQWTKLQLMEGAGAGSQYQHQTQKGPSSGRGTGSSGSGGSDGGGSRGK